jgi:hypothetical protein
MDKGTLIVAVIILLLIIVPVVFIARAGRKNPE